MSVVHDLRVGTNGVRVLCGCLTILYERSGREGKWEINFNGFLACLWYTV